MSDNNDLGFAIGRTARILYRLLDDNLRSLGLGFAQIKVLGFLSYKEQAGEEVTQKLLKTECLSTRSSSVTGVLQGLERQGYIVREAGEDARVKRVVLTPRGAEVSKECLSYVQKTEEVMRRRLTKEEQETTLRCLFVMADELEAFSLEHARLPRKQGDN